MIWSTAIGFANIYRHYSVYVYYEVVLQSDERPNDYCFRVPDFDEDRVIIVKVLPSLSYEALRQPNSDSAIRNCFLKGVSFACLVSKVAFIYNQLNHFCKHRACASICHIFHHAEKSINLRCDTFSIAT